MGNSLRCCLACVLPCGALDLIRIVHLNGRIEEYGRPVAAGEILAANPNHVLSKPCSQGVVRRILIVSPESELERGEIYFLIPAASVPPEKKTTKGAKSQHESQGDHRSVKAAASCGDGETTKSDGRHDLSSRKKPSSHRRRTSAGSRTAVWRPHLDCIVE
ncbi:hypothetical protein QOZ80_5AG0403520 [Eleusine coracana subsp. coracana]|nr:hypothetical protein QOZ80_5AG0403520 [Eleusine coracana subsp. coracana]